VSGKGSWRKGAGAVSCGLPGQMGYYMPAVQPTTGIESPTAGFPKVALFSDKPRLMSFESTVAEGQFTSQRANSPLNVETPAQWLS